MLVKNIFSVFPQRIPLPLKMSSNINNLLVSSLLIYLFIIIGSFEQMSGTKISVLLWLSYLIILMFFIKSISIRILSPNSSINSSRLFLPLMFFFIWCLITFIINGGNIVYFLKTFKDYIKYILLYYAIINSNLTFINLRSFIILLFSIVLLQIPITMYQYYFIESHPDLNCGTFGLTGTGQLLIWIVIAISGTIGYLLVSTEKFISLSLLIILLFTVPLFGSARAIFYYLPLILLCIGVHQKQFVKYFILGSIVGIPAIIFIYFKTDIKMINPIDIAKYSNVLLQDNIGTGISVIPGRFFDIINTFNYTFDNYKNIIFGNGFGSLKGELLNFAASGNTNVIGLQTQLANTLIDIGVVGLILYFWIILVAYKETRKFFHLIYSKETQDPFLCAIANAALASVFMFFFCITYHGIWWSVYSSFPFWFFMAVVYKYNHGIIKAN